MKKTIYLIILQAIFTCASVQAGTILPTDDTFIDEYSPTTIYGTQQYLIVRNMNLSGYVLDTLVKFNLSSIPIGSFVISAKLNLYYYHYNDANPVGNPLNAHCITSAWSESTTNWNNRPTYNATASSTVSGPSSYGWIQWDVRSDVQDFVNGTKTNYGWQIMDASSKNSMIYFYPKEYTDSNYRPYLEVAYGTIYVDVNATGSNNGTSWTNAFNKLQDAMAIAGQGVKIWVARGTYKPDQGGGKTLGDRTATFQLINGVSIYGGFAGGETTLGQRDWQNNLTILSGDIGTLESSSDNSYHILTGITGAVLDGFVIRDGNANGSYPNDSGAGIYNSAASPTLANCTITGNSAAQYGGAMYNRDDSNPVLTNCSITDNSAKYGGAIYNYSSSDPILTDCAINDNSAQYGAGMYNHGSSSPRFIRCTLTANTATNYGGAIMNYMSDPRLTNCILSGNTAQYGGGIHNNDSSPLITNCIFISNSATNDGGGIWNYSDSNPVLTNCSLISNSAGGNGGGIYNLVSPVACSPVLANCILWGNSDSSGTGQAAQINSGTPVVTYSCIKDNDPNDTSIPFGGAANHNIDDNPLFWNAGSGNLRITGNSPCIEAGSNPAVPADALDLDADGNISEQTPFDLDNRNRFSDGDCDGNAVVDMGAYELIWVYLGDLNADCSVNFLDFDVMADNWLAGK